MEYKKYSFDFRSVKIIPPMPGHPAGNFLFETKIIYMTAPDGRVLWKENGPLPFHLGNTIQEGEEKAKLAAFAWIDKRVSGGGEE